MEKHNNTQKKSEYEYKRIILIVLDSVGIGEMPDSAKYGDAGSDTLGHIFKSVRVTVPNLQSIGLGNIRPMALDPVIEPLGNFGVAATASDGKDTTIGHWEITGLITEKAFPTYPNGFPQYIINRFESAIGRRVIGNKPASGTEIINELGAKHMHTGKPILYTSADSVFQIAAHEEVIPIKELYRYCEI